MWYFWHALQAVKFPYSLTIKKWEQALIPFVTKFKYRINSRVILKILCRLRKKTVNVLISIAFFNTNLIFLGQVNFYSWCVSVCLCNEEMEVWDKSGLFITVHSWWCRNWSVTPLLIQLRLPLHFQRRWENSREGQEGMASASPPQSKRVC